VASNEWVDWHARYGADPGRDGRLEAVRTLIRTCLSEAAPGPIRIVSMCAGDGRDLLEVLRDHPRAADVRARLIDLDATLVARGRATIADIGARHVEFVEGDAAEAASYAGAVPADLVLACGIFGNITDDEVRRTVQHSPRLCGPGGQVIWTRGRFEPDLTPWVRGWFTDAGFEERAFVRVPGSTASVGLHRLRGAAQPLEWAGRLFTFLPLEKRPSQIARNRSTPPAAEGEGEPPGPRGDFR
jgi:hypothetical protein